ncbi:MAG: hypothetical protein SFT92_01960 [Rickettsiales bacterium]|nr:hypothetical protein [Rickettsiales bacterium]
MTSNSIPQHGTSQAAPSGGCPFAQKAGKSQPFTELGEMLHVMRMVSNRLDVSDFGTEYIHARSFLREGRPHRLATGATEVMQAIHSELRRSVTNMGSLLDRESLPAEVQQAIEAYEASLEAYRNFLKPYVKDVVEEWRGEDISHTIIEKIYNHIPALRRRDFMLNLNEKRSACEKALIKLDEQMDGLPELPLRLYHKADSGQKQPISIRIPNEERGHMGINLLLLASTSASIDESQIPLPAIRLMKSYMDDGAVGITREPVTKLYQAIQNGLAAQHYDETARHEILRDSQLLPNEEHIQEAVEKNSQALSLYHYVAQLIVAATDRKEAMQEFGPGLKALARYVSPYTHVRNTHEAALIGETLLMGGLDTLQDTGSRLRYEQQILQDHINGWRAVDAVLITSESVGPELRKAIETFRLPEHLAGPIRGMIDSKWQKQARGSKGSGFLQEQG